MRCIAIACRGGFALLLLLPGWSQRAWGQRDLVLPRMEIGQVLAAKQARDAQVNALVEDYRQRLRTELVFVRRVCELTPEQSLALEKHGEEIVARAKEQFSDAIENQRADRRLVVVNNRRVMVVGDRIVAVAGGAPHDESSALQLAMADDVDAAVRQTLPDHIAARLTEERQRVNEKAKRAKAQVLAAAMDEILLLTDKQREQLCGILTSLWNENWTPVAIKLDRGSHNFSPKMSVLLRAKLGGLGGACDLPDVMLEPLLRPAQMAMWKEIRKPLNAQAAMQAERMNAQLVQLQQVQQQRRAGMVAGGNVRVRRVAVPGAAGAVRVVIEPQPAQVAAAAAPVRPGVNAQDEAPIKAPPEQNACLELVLDALGQACELSSEAREKFYWAGKLDLRRQAERAAVQQRELLEKAAQANFAAVAPPSSEFAAPYGLLADESSLLHKAARSRISAEQWQVWREEQSRRLEFQRQARLDFCVFTFSQRSPLTSAQWDALAELVRSRLGEIPADQSAVRQATEISAAIARIPNSEFRPLFDDVQWPAISRRLQELRLEAPQIKP